MPEHDRLLLFTGWPGFIGRRLVERLLDNDPEVKIVCLTEPRFCDTEAPDRVEIVAGDITKQRLDLDASTYDRLTKQVTEVFHLAAIYDLAVPLDIARKVNVEGTGNVVDLCADCERLERHNYVSTAYVAGMRTGNVYEHELVEGQEFKNHYESTKYQAEVWVHSSMDAVPTTIYRPAIVVGDSQTGETPKFDGPYYVLGGISRLRSLYVPMVNLGSPDSSFNVVPVDFVVDAIATASREPEAKGATLHLVDPDPVSSERLFELLSEAYDGSSTPWRLPSALVAQLLRSGLVRDLFKGMPRESMVYLNHPVRFDTRQSEALLGPHGVHCPPITDYVDVITEYYREHEDD